MLINITEIIDGTLVNAIAATGRMLASSASDVRSRRSADDLDIARWFETYRFTSELPELPAVSTVTAKRLAEGSYSACVAGVGCGAGVHG